MSDKQNELLEDILQELRLITATLQSLTEYRVQWLRDKSNDIASTLDSPGSNNAIEQHQKVEEKNSLTVDDWLENNGITISNHRERNASDEIFEKLALFLGDKLENISRIYEVIKRSVSTGNSFTVNLSSNSQDEIADATQFCAMLNSYAFLATYRYNRSTKTINASPQRVGMVINFFTGGWFERYVYLGVQDLISRSDLLVTSLLNPQITFADGDDTELDLVFLVDGHPLWLECKTGDYQNYITKYPHIRKLLSVPKERAILVVLGISDTLCDQLTALYDITVANEKTFLNKVREALAIEHSPPVEHIIQQTTMPVPSTSLATLLNKAGMRPLPEHRSLVIRELIEWTGQQEQPIAIIEFKRQIAERLPTSNSQLQDILRAIIRGKCLLDENEERVQSFTIPFSRLISTDVAVIDQKCIESYVRAVLMVNPKFFEITEKISEFETVVGGKAPDAMTVKSIVQELLES